MGRRIKLVLTGFVTLSALSLGVPILMPTTSADAAVPFSCPGSVGGRTLAGPSNVGIPGEWVIGDASASTSYLIDCTYPDPSGQWDVEVAWTPPGNTTTTSWGCGAAPPSSPAAGWVSKDHWAYATVSVDNPPADLALAAQAALAQVAPLAEVCPTAATAKTPPTSSGTAKPAALPTLSLGVSVSRPGRMTSTDHPDGMTTKADVNPTSWPVDINIHFLGETTCPAGALQWKVAGHTVHVRRESDPCTFLYESPKQGAFPLQVIVTTSDAVYSGSTTIKIRDFLIVGLGDSNGSGEGTPDVVGGQLWANQRCDRSANSFESQAATEIEQNSQATVTFVHLACSGASIQHGIIGPYRGINDPGGAPLPSQVSNMQSLVGTRKVDAVVVSIGINDFGFGSIVSFCVQQDNCPAQSYPTGSTQTLDQYVHSTLLQLPRLYNKMAARLSAARVPRGKVFITQYFDPTHDASGTGYCDPLIGNPLGATGSFTSAEAKWASTRLLAPLNAAIARAARVHHWNLVSGAAQGFQPHGYCSPDTWIVQVSGSKLSQGDLNGGLHANLAGNRFDAGLVVAKLKGALH